MTASIRNSRLQPAGTGRPPDSLKAEPSPDEDSAPAPSDVPVTKSGDVWLLGEHRLICGDATDAAGYSAVLSGEPAGIPQNYPTDHSLSPLRQPEGFETCLRSQ